MRIRAVACPLLAASTVLTGCGGKGGGGGGQKQASTPPAPVTTSTSATPRAPLQRLRLTAFVVHSRLVGESLEQVVLKPEGGSKRPLLVLLPGAGAPPAMYLSKELFRGLQGMRGRAPVVVMANGAGFSWFHDRVGGKWGSYVLHEVIPQAARRFNADPGRVAIGGISMGGFGALDIARLAPRRFCAVGGHSPALFRSFLEAPRFAFDNQRDYDRHDVFSAARKSGRPYGSARVWIDVGKADSLVPAATADAALLRARGTDVKLHLWPGGHTASYWRAHMRAYLRFYADALARC